MEPVRAGAVRGKMCNSPRVSPHETIRGRRFMGLCRGYSTVMCRLYQEITRLRGVQLSICVMLQQADIACATMLYSTTVQQQYSSTGPCNTCTITLLPVLWVVLLFALENLRF